MRGNERRAADEADRRHRGRQTDRRRRMALPLQDEGEQRIGQALRDGVDRDRRDHAGERRPMASPRLPSAAGLMFGADRCVAKAHAAARFADRSG